MARGVLQIVRFNWPFYAGASAAIALTVPDGRRIAGRP